MMLMSDANVISCCAAVLHFKINIINIITASFVINLYITFSLLIAITVQ